MTIYVWTNCICHVTIIYFAKKLEKDNSFLMFGYGFAQLHMVGVMVCLYGFAVITYVIHSLHKEATLQSSYTGNL